MDGIHTVIVRRIFSELFGPLFTLSQCWPPLGRRTVAILSLSHCVPLCFISFHTSVSTFTHSISFWHGVHFSVRVCVVHTVYVRVLFSFIRFLWPNNIVWNLNSTFVLLHLPLLLTRRGKKRWRCLHGTMRIAYIKSAVNNTVSCTINFFSARFRYTCVSFVLFQLCVQCFFRSLFYLRREIPDSNSSRLLFPNSFCILCLLCFGFTWL